MENVRTQKLPARIQSLLSQSQIVGRHLEEVKEGKKTVQEIIHTSSTAGIGSAVHIGRGAISRNHKSAPMTYTEVVGFLKDFLKKLNSSNIKNKRATYHGIWGAYHELVVKWLYPWDQEVSELHVMTSLTCVVWCAQLYLFISNASLLFLVSDSNATQKRR